MDKKKPKTTPDFCLDDRVWGWDVNWDREERGPTMTSVVGVLS